MTPAERLIAQMRAQRLSWVEVAPAVDGAPAKRVQLLRPTETEQSEFVQPDGDGYRLVAELPQVRKYVVGWDGFTESDLVGPAGGSDPVPFAPDLWAAVCSDSAAYTLIVARGLLDLIVSHRAAREADRKN